MTQVEKRRRKKTNKDLIIIVLLLIIIIALTIYIIFSKIDSKDDITRKNFLSTMQTAQSELSYYVCEMEKDTFGIYTKLEILTGKVTNNKDTNDENKEDDSIIKDNKGNQVTSLVEIDKNYGTEENPIYKVNVVDLQKILNISVEQFEGLDWYIKDGITLKVGFENSRPSWWEDTFDVFTIK